MKKQGIFLGLFLIVMGFLWLLSSLEIIDISIYDFFSYIRRLLSFWPLLLINLGISILTENKVVRNLVIVLSVLAVVFDFLINYTILGNLI